MVLRKAQDGSVSFPRDSKSPQRGTLDSAAHLEGLRQRKEDAQVSS